ncbi:MAG TPA: type II toxin-antitoxin system RelE/ParE family toxin [Dehalococcoidia bacterium]|nr:type II toxin-antitoxin system RelE/ParE family toxin [Dehalococcoidia bacterium]
MEWFAKHVDEVPAEPLTGRYRGLYRLRIGSYRAIYSLQRDRHAIVVHAVRHRREAYR